MAAASGDVSIVRAGRERFAELEPLWKALHDRHAEITPQLGPLRARDPGESWRRRVAQYDRWIEEAGSLVLIAERGGRAVGYAFVTIGRALATWASGERIAELQTLSVLPEAQDGGVGTALLEAVRGELAEAGISELIVTTTLTNERSHRFYQRRGLQPIFTTFLGKVEEP